jgi:Transcriptional regulator, AbiEi antitoxin, Type IV TA system
MSAASLCSTSTAFVTTCRSPVLRLFGWTAGRLPPWFTERFPAEYHRKRLFTEKPDALLHVHPFENRKGAPLVSSPERALLEVFSEVSIRQPLQEARELVESTYSLRADVLRDLMKRCTSVKTVRLCLQLGNERRASITPCCQSAILAMSGTAAQWRQGRGEVPRRCRR